MLTETGCGVIIASDLAMLVSFTESVVADEQTVYLHTRNESKRAVDGMSVNMGKVEQCVNDVNAAGNAFTAITAAIVGIYQ
jgi:hypothetical protein